MPRPKPDNPDLDQPVTLRDFREFTAFAAATFLTKEEALTTFATKEDLKVFAASAFKTFATKDDLQEAVSGLATKEELRTLRTDVLTSNELILKELKAMRDEQAAHLHQHDRQDQEIRTLQGRVRCVEDHVGIEPSAL